MEARDSRGGQASPWEQTAACAPKTQERYGYLLDGQQRLTALLLVRERDDAYPLLYYAWPDAERDGDKRFYWRGRNETPNPWSISDAADALHDGFDVAAKLAELRDDPEWKPEHEGPVLAGLAALKAIRNYPVGILEFETDDYRKATELFVRFNSTGRKLPRGDLAMARLAIDLPDRASSRIRPAAGRWKAMGFTAPFLVQCLLAVHTGRFQMQEPEKLWAGEDGKRVRESWTKTERAVNRLVGFLTGTLKWGAGREIPSLTALVPLVFLLAEGARGAGRSCSAPGRWLLLASLHGYFSGSSQTKLDQVLKALGGERTPARLWSYTKRDLPKLSDDDFLTSRIGGPAMSLYLSMLREAKARDWGPGLEYLDGTVAGHGSALQVHHFFPRALLKKHKVKASDIDTFANYVVIRQDTNLHAGADEPASYIEVALAAAGKDAKQVRAAIRKQSVPDGPELWRVANYAGFLAERRDGGSRPRRIASSASKSPALAAVRREQAGVRRTGTIRTSMQDHRLSPLSAHKRAAGTCPWGFSGQNSRSGR